MKTLPVLFVVSALAFISGFATAKDAMEFHSGTGADRIFLRGPESGAQVVIMDEKGGDLTREVEYSVEPSHMAKVDSAGFVTPLANGRGTLIAKGKNGEVSAALEIVDFKNAPPISFPNDVVPVFTRNHCNAGACHAKATGQNGFQLSLLGYEPKADYEQIVLHSRGRRVLPAAPSHSLLLMKATGDLPHEGGARLDKNSADYRILKQWITSGLNYRPDNDPDIEKISIFPKTAVTKPGAEIQVAVTAYFSDGTERDITRLAQYESNNPDRILASETGLMTVRDKNGNASVLVRFQEHIDTLAVTIPIGNPVDSLPAPENFIDEHIFSQLKLMGLPPSGEVDDSTFLRRVTIDIAGRLPTIEETKSFLATSGADKRAKKIDQLLDSPDYADYFAGKWAGILRNKVERGRPWVHRDSHAFYAWIRKSLIENKPFDQFAGDLILASGKAYENPAVSWYRVVKDEKERMENVAQVFLGVRMQCAQCHHHPYEQWSMDDYFAFTAFFSTVKAKNIRKLPEENIYHHNRKAAVMKQPLSGEMLKPRLLGHEESEDIPPMVDPRFALADWLTEKENPRFARVLVNRYWKHFFSRGLVEPEDDIRPTNPATHPALLDALADSFRDSGYDLKALIRTMCNSATYQRSSDPSEQNIDDNQNYARYYPKRLQAEVLLDSVNEMTGSKNSFQYQPLGVRAVSLPNEKGTTDSPFLMMFGRPSMDTACECERTDEANLGQSLHLLNSDDIQKKLSNGNGLAASLAKDTETGDKEKITNLYLRALSREPDESELQMAISHLNKKREAKAEREGYEDLIWAMINMKEFMFNR